jgi:hypothetical protein
MEKKIFKKLEMEEKARILAQDANVAATRTYFQFRVILLSVFGFFVEVWYRDSNKLVQKIIVQDDLPTLELYLKNVDYSEIFNLLKGKKK